MNAQRGELETLNPALICIDCDTQSREGNDEATIEEYAEAMRQGAQFPPVVVFLEHDEQGNEIYWCADGHHRVAAAIRAEIEEIDATVYKGSREDAALYSCGANQSHGLKRSPQDKRSAARRCMKLRPEWSDRKVAEHCGIDHKTVADERRRAQATGEIPQLEERVGKDGKARALPTKAAEPAPSAAADAERIVVALQAVYHQTGVMPGDLVSADEVWCAWLELLQIQDRPDNNEWLSARWDAALKVGIARGLFLEHREQLALPGASRAPGSSSDKTSVEPPPDPPAIKSDEEPAPLDFGTVLHTTHTYLRELADLRWARAAISAVRARVEAKLGQAISEEMWIRVVGAGQREGFWEHSGVILQGAIVEGDIWLKTPAAKALATQLEKAQRPEPPTMPADLDDPAAQGHLASLEEDPDDDEDEDDDDTDADDDTAHEDEETEGESAAPAPRGEAELLRDALQGASVGNKDGLVPAAKAREAFAYLLGVEAVTDDRWTRAVRLAREAGLVHVVGGSLRLAPEQPPARPGLPNGERAALDAYWTPDGHARALVRWLDERVLLSRGAPEFILEPSVGGGAWLRAARDQWPEAKLRAIDLDPTAPGLKLADEPSVGDFLQADLLGCDVVLGNPPYSAELPAWVDASRAVAPVVAYLLRETVTGSLERLPWWQDRPPAWIVKVLPRPRWEGPGARASTDTSDTVLVVWVHGEHDTRYRWLDVREGA